MVARELLAGAVVAAAAMRPAAGAGLALQFEGVNPVAGLRGGSFDTLSPALNGIMTEMTIVAWVRNEEDHAGNTLPIQIGDDLNTFAVGNPLRMLAGGRSIQLDPIAPEDIYKWHHYAMTVTKTSDELVIQAYVDGTVAGSTSVSGVESSQPLLGGADATLRIGTQNLGPRNEPSRLHWDDGWVGIIDEFTVFAGVKTETEIASIMASPLDPQAMPSDAVLHYSFELNCTHLISSGECDAVKPAAVTNYGSAGYEYDLILGRRFDSADDGAKYWTDRLAGTWPFQAPSLVTSTVPFSGPLPPSLPTSIFASFNEVLQVPVMQSLVGSFVQFAEMPAAADAFLEIDGSSMNPGDSTTVPINAGGSLTINVNANPFTLPLVFHMRVYSDAAASLFIGDHFLYVWPMENMMTESMPLHFRAIENTMLTFNPRKMPITTHGRPVSVMLEMPPSQGGKVSELTPSGEVIELLPGTLTSATKLGYLPGPFTSSGEVETFMFMFMVGSMMSNVIMIDAHRFLNPNLSLPPSESSGRVPEYEAIIEEAIGRGITCNDGGENPGGDCSMDCFACDPGMCDSPRCMWNSEMGMCTPGGPAGDCSNDCHACPDDVACSGSMMSCLWNPSLNQCSYQTGGSGGCPDTCEQCVDQNNCETNMCMWDFGTNMCKTPGGPTGDCSNDCHACPDQMACSGSMMSCLWDPSINQCSYQTGGSGGCPDTCEQCVDQNNCETNMCMWDFGTNMCKTPGGPDCSNDCYACPDQMACSGSMMSCSWDPSLNQCSYQTGGSGGCPDTCEQCMDQNNCETNMCMWDFGTNMCKTPGGPTGDCSNDCHACPDQMACSGSMMSCLWDPSINQCSYQTGGSGGCPDTCEQCVDQNNCETNMCMWDFGTNMCKTPGGPDCSNDCYACPDDVACSGSMMSCSWDPSLNQCSYQTGGSGGCPDNCEQCTDQNNCETNMCMWDFGTNMCSTPGGPDCSNDCYACPDQMACSGSMMSCSWDPSINQCSYQTGGSGGCPDNCEQCVDQNNCETNMCMWDFGTNMCSTPGGPDCSNDCYACPDQMACSGSMMSCSWDPSINQCSYQTGGSGGCPDNCEQCTDQNNCETNMCMWDFGTNMCSTPGGPDCSNDCYACPDQMACSGSMMSCLWDPSINQCSYQTGGSGGCPDTCEQCVDQNNCETNMCMWDFGTNMCKTPGGPDCSNDCYACPDQMACSGSMMGCSWDPSINQCSYQTGGSGGCPDNCEQCGDQNSCETNMCMWDFGTNMCSTPGGPDCSNDCYACPDDVACSGSMMGCSWNPSINQCSYQTGGSGGCPDNCEQCGDQNSCETNMCMWDPGMNTCASGGPTGDCSNDCYACPDQMTCSGSSMGCSWDGVMCASMGRRLLRAGSSRQLEDGGSNEPSGSLVQFASEVIKVSSFWGSGFYVGYHAINVVGPPSCTEAGECTGSDRPLMPGDLVTVRRDSLDVPALVLGMNMSAFVVEPLPLFRLKNPEEPSADAWEFELCEMKGTSYPTDCLPIPSEPDAILVNETDIRRDFPGSWAPLRKGLEPSSDDSTNQAVAFGPQFSHFKGQNESYFGHHDGLPYTEFIEVRFEQPVYPVGVEVGSPRGGGAVVNIRAFNPESQDWVLIHAKNIDHDAAEAFSMSHVYQRHLFTELCHLDFRTDIIRLELDTSAETGIADWNYIDYIKLLGKEEGGGGNEFDPGLWHWLSAWIYHGMVHDGHIPETP